MKHKEDYEQIVFLINEKKYEEAKELFSDILMEEVTEKLIEKKDEIMEKLKLESIGIKEKENIEIEEDE